MARFAFIVHALSPVHRMFMGVRRAELSLALGAAQGVSPWSVGRVCELGLKGIAEGEVVGIPLAPDQVLADPERLVQRMERAVRVAQAAGPLDAVGLGSLCAVVGGRGEALAARVDVPVTTGAAATAWAMHGNVRALLGVRSGPVAVIGANGPVGRVLTQLLAADGVALRVDSKRAGRGPKITVCATPEETVQGCSVVVGAGPTGGTLDPSAVQSGAVIVDVALPGTLTGPPQRGVRVLAGEAVCLPRRWTRGGWGRLYHVFAGYGPRQVFACVIEPLVLAHTGRGRPFALGRRIDPDAVREFGAGAEALGFRPRLALGWVAVPPKLLGGA